jgi:putative spermidine/putrescine transport system ATP-binding protein
VLQAGRTEQIGTPSELYLRPANRFVANFVGLTNELEVVGVQAQHPHLRVTTRGGLVVSVPAETALPGGGAGAWLVVRPESVRLAVAPGEVDNRYEARVDDLIYLGGLTRCRLLVGETAIVAVVPSSATARFKPGDVVPIGWNAEECAVSRGA